MGEDNGIFLFFKFINGVNKRRIGGPFKFRDKIRDFLIKVVCCGFDFIIIFKATFRGAGHSANAILNQSSGHFPN